MLKELKQKYLDIQDEIFVLEANGNLSKLCNLRDQFDETFDGFFDRKELREKYNAWNEEENAPNFNFTNSDLEKMLDVKDLKDLIEYYNHCIDILEERLNELKNPIPEWWEINED